MKWLVYLVGIFVTLSVGATTLIWWDTAPEKTPMAKYRLGQQEDLGLIVYESIRETPKIWSFECIGSEKDCAEERLVYRGDRPGDRPHHWPGDRPHQCRPGKHGGHDCHPVSEPVPEPGTLVLFGLGLVGVSLFRKMP